jgi:hypothetical protein
MVHPDSRSVVDLRGQIDRARQDRAALDAVVASLADVLTDGTAEAILTHNLTGAQVCGWRPAKAGGEPGSDRQADG